MESFSREWDPRVSSPIEPPNSAEKDWNPKSRESSADKFWKSPFFFTVPITPFLVVNRPGTSFLLWQIFPASCNPQFPGSHFYSSQEGLHLLDCLNSMKSFYLIPLLAIFCSCSVLVGQVKPLEEKSVNQPTPAQSLDALGWKKISTHDPRDRSSELPDETWQSPSTSAVISMNSVCRKSAGVSHDLKSVTRVLLSQWDNLKIQDQSPTTLRDFPAMRTTARGRSLGLERRFQIIVVKTPTCVYDLIFLSPVETFDHELSVFERFRDNLDLK
jgi:hypothetical protein